MNQCITPGEGHVLYTRGRGMYQCITLRGWVMNQCITPGEGHVLYTRGRGMYFTLGGGACTLH